MSIEIYRGDTQKINLIFTTCTNKPKATLVNGITEGDTLTSIVAQLKNASQVIQPTGVLELSACGGEVEEIAYTAIVIDSGQVTFTVSHTADGNYPAGTEVTIDGGRIDITGGSIDGEIRPKRDSDIVLKNISGGLLNGSMGSAQIVMTSSDTDLDVGSYNFTVVYTDINSETHTVVNTDLRIL